MATCKKVFFLDFPAWTEIKKKKILDRGEWFSSIILKGGTGIFMIQKKIPAKLISNIKVILNNR